MGCRILEGVESGTDVGYACFFCSTSMVAFGPVFSGEAWYGCESPTAEAEAFLKWLENHPVTNERTGRLDSDPRAYPDSVLSVKYAQFRNELATGKAVQR